MNERFSKLYQWLRRMPDVSDGAKVLWCFLRDWQEYTSREGRDPGLSKAAMMDETGRSLDAVERRLLELTARGMLVVEYRSGKPSVWRCVVPAGMSSEEDTTRSKHPGVETPGGQSTPGSKHPGVETPGGVGGVFDPPGGGGNTGGSGGCFHPLNKTQDILKTGDDLAGARTGPDRILGATPVAAAREPDHRSDQESDRSESGRLTGPQYPVPSSQYPVPSKLPSEAGPHAPLAGDCAREPAQRSTPHRGTEVAPPDSMPSALGWSSIGETFSRLRSEAWQRKTGNPGGRWKPGTRDHGGISSALELFRDEPDPQAALEDSIRGFLADAWAFERDWPFSVWAVDPGKYRGKAILAERQAGGEGGRSRDVAELVADIEARLRAARDRAHAVAGTDEAKAARALVESIRAELRAAHAQAEAG